MFDISILFIYVDSDFPPNFLSLLFTFPLLYTAKLIILWYDNFGKNRIPLQRAGMAAITKIKKVIFEKTVLGLISASN